MQCSEKLGAVIPRAVQPGKRASGLFAFLILLLAGCGAPPPAEQAIEASLERIETAIESQNAVALMMEVHDDFSYQRGDGEPLNRMMAKKLAGHTLRSYRDLSVTLTNIRVEPDAIREDMANVKFNALITAGGGRSFLPEDGNLYRVDSVWLFDDDWKVQQMTVRRALE